MRIRGALERKECLSWGGTHTRGGGMNGREEKGEGGGKGQSKTRRKWGSLQG